MMKKAIKKVTAVALSLAMLGAVGAAAAACSKEDDNTLVYWCFDSAMKDQVEEFYPSEEELGYKVEVEVIELSPAYGYKPAGRRRFRSGRVQEIYGRRPDGEPR